MHNSSDNHATLEVGVTSTQSLPIITTGHWRLHSWRHFFGLHFSLLMIAIRSLASASSPPPFLSFLPLPFFDGIRVELVHWRGASLKEFQVSVLNQSQPKKPCSAFDLWRRRVVGVVAAQQLQIGTLVPILLFRFPPFFVFFLFAVFLPSLEEAEWRRLFCPATLERKPG